MVMGLVAEVPQGGLPQSSRAAVYGVMEALVARCPGLAGIDAVSGFLQLMDGEKDPRCLVVAFRVVRALCARFVEEAGHFLEDVFEVTSCYFPISFAAPPGGDFGVTEEDLVAALRAALTAHPGLAEYTVPFCLEKLGASDDSAKADALAVLAAGARGAFRAQCGPFEREVWAALRAEITHGTAANVVDAALDALAAFAACPGTQLAAPVAEHCAHFLREPSNKAARSAGRMLLSVIGTPAGDAALARVLPVLTEVHLAAATPGDQQAVVELLRDIALATVTVASSSAPTTTPVMLKTLLVGVVSAAAGVTAEAAAAAQGLAALGEAPEAVAALLARAPADLLQAPADSAPAALRSLAQSVAALARRFPAVTLQAALAPLLALPLTPGSAAHQAVLAIATPVPAHVALVVERVWATGSTPLLLSLKDLAFAADPAFDLLAPRLVAGAPAQLADAAFAILVRVVACAGVEAQRLCVAACLASASASAAAAVLTALRPEAVPEAAASLSALVPAAGQQAAVARANLVAKGGADPRQALQAAIEAHPEGLGWLCRALAATGSPLLPEASAALRAQAARQVPGAGDAYALVLSPASAQLLGPATHVRARLLFEQKFFTTELPALLEGGGALLACVAGMIKALPRPVVAPEVPRLLPALVATVATGSATDGALEIIREAAHTNPQLVSNHIDDLIPGILKGLPAWPCRAREQALLLLAALPATCQFHMIAPHKKQVTETLKRFLDDHKRVVRGAAVSAVSKWQL